LARNLASPCFGREPKARVATEKKPKWQQFEEKKEKKKEKDQGR